MPFGNYLRFLFFNYVNVPSNTYTTYLRKTIACIILKTITENYTENSTSTELLYYLY